MVGTINRDLVQSDFRRGVGGAYDLEWWRKAIGPNLA